MAPIYFFTQHSNLIQQRNSKTSSPQTGQEFGPDYTNGTPEQAFRTTSRFNLGVDSKAYAAMDGKIILLDNNSDPTLVNAVIMPTSINTLDLTPGILFIVYRGLKRSDFMTGSPGSYQLITNQTGGTDFMNYHNTNLVNSLSNTPPSISNFAYSNTPISQTELLINLFNVFTYNQMAVIKQGMYFGNFPAVSGGGIDIVLNENKFSPDVNFGQANDYLINITNFNNSAQPGQEAYNILFVREGIHNFIDPVVLYNLYWTEGVDYDGASQPATGDSIYTDLLGTFVNKNAIYFDIRNNNDYSFNYYKDNQDPSFQFNFLLRTNDNSTNDEVTNFNSTLYYTNYWPIMRVNSGTPLSNYNYYFFDFKFFGTYNPQPLLYYDFAITPSSVDYKTASTETITDFFVASENWQKLDYCLNTNNQPLDVNGDSNYRRIITPCTSASPITTAWLVKLYIIRTKNPTVNPLPATVVTFDSSLDNVFGRVGGNIANGLAFPFNFAQVDYQSVWQIGLSKVFLPAGEGHMVDMMVQTGVGISSNDVTFFVIELDRAQYTFSSLNSFISGNASMGQTGNLNIFSSGTSQYTDIKQSYSINYDSSYTQKTLSDGTNMLSINQGVDPFKAQSNNIKRSFLLTLNFTFAEYTAIVAAIPTSTLNPAFHSINFGFDMFQNLQDGNNYYYGYGRVKLLGMDNSGVAGEYTQISSLSGNLFYYTDDYRSYGTALSGSDPYISADYKDNKVSDPNSLIHVSDYITIVKEIEAGFRKIPSIGALQAGEVITRIREYYYGYKDRDSKFGRRNWLLNPFDNAILDAPYTNGLDSLNPETNDVFTDSHFQMLTSHADAESLGDNPSPDIIDPNNNLIDVGHLLFGLDGLIHDYNKTGAPFTKFQIYSSNDFTGYIADVFPCAAESRIYTNQFNQKYLTCPIYPATLDNDRIYEINAPNDDILGDVDAFGLFNVYIYFSNNPLPSWALGDPQYDVNGNTGKPTLAFLLQYFYDPAYDPANSSVYPDNLYANYKKRWLNFCRGFDTNGDLLQIPSASPNSLVYQGYVEWNGSKYVWMANNPVMNPIDYTNLHISLQLLKKRGEIYAHFWYQQFFGAFSFSATGNPKDLQVNDPTNTILVRFEDPGHLTIIDTPQINLSSTLGSASSDTEVLYFMNKFLNFVQTEFQNENP